MSYNSSHSLFRPLKILSLSVNLSWSGQDRYSKLFVQFVTFSKVDQPFAQLERLFFAIPEKLTRITFLGIISYVLRPVLSFITQQINYLQILSETPVRGPSTPLNIHLSNESIGSEKIDSRFHRPIMFGITHRENLLNSISIT